VFRSSPRPDDIADFPREVFRVFPETGRHRIVSMRSVPVFPETGRRRRLSTRSVPGLPRDRAPSPTFPPEVFRSNPIPGSTQPKTYRPRAALESFHAERLRQEVGSNGFALPATGLHATKCRGPNKSLSGEARSRPNENAKRKQKSKSGGKSKGNSTPTRVTPNTLPQDPRQPKTRTRSTHMNRSRGARHRLFDAHPG